MKREPIADRSSRYAASTTEDATAATAATASSVSTEPAALIRLHQRSSAEPSASELQSQPSALPIPEPCLPDAVARPILSATTATRHPFLPSLFLFSIPLEFVPLECSRPAESAAPSWYPTPCQSQLPSLSPTSESTAPTSAVCQQSLRPPEGTPRRSRYTRANSRASLTSG
jgi:hypothetical protein